MAKDEKPRPMVKKTPVAKDMKPISVVKKRPVAKDRLPSAADRMKARDARRQARRSYTTVARPAGAEVETAELLDSLQSRFGALQSALLLTDLNDDLEDMDSALAMLPVTVEEMRTRGYVFGGFLERKIEKLQEQWGGLRQRVTQEIDRRSRELERESEEAERALSAARSGGRTAVARAESAIQTLEHKLSAAQDAIEGMFDQLDVNVTQTQRQIEQIGWMLDQVDTAAFQLYPAEDPVAAASAQYMETKKEGPKGVLYLTDERLIFEQKEEVATKKVLFITTEKETVQETIFEVPVGQIEEVKASQKGFLGRKEMLELAFAPEADLSGATLRLHGADNEEWAALIGRVRSGDIAKERIAPKKEEAIEAARAAPTKCPTCGATLAVEIVRGVREITCEYCGSVIRL